MKTNGIKVALAVMMMAASAGANAQHSVKVRVENVPSGEGKVLVTTSNGRRAMVQAAKGTVELVLDSVPEGRCTVYAMHDSNGDYDPNNKDGLPQEYCWMQNVDVTAEGQVVTIGLNYIPQYVKKQQNKK